MPGSYDSLPKAYRVYTVDPASGAPVSAVGGGSGPGGSTPISGAPSLQLAPAITTTAPQYTAGDVVGGVLTLTAAVRSSGGAGLLQSLLVTDRANQKAPLTILLFDSAPAGTYTDNAACPTLGADTAKLIRKVNVVAADYETIGGVAVADLAAVSKVVKASGSADLKAVVVTTGTPTYGANATDLSIRFGLLPD